MILSHFRFLLFALGSKRRRNLLVSLVKLAVHFISLRRGTIFMPHCTASTEVMVPPQGKAARRFVRANRLSTLLANAVALFFRLAHIFESNVVSIPQQHLLFPSPLVIPIDKTVVVKPERSAFLLDLCRDNPDLPSFVQLDIESLQLI